MITEGFTFLSKDGKTTVHAVKWMPDSGEFHAILQITHGMVEYIKRYEPFAEYLTKKGYLVVGHDHIGHGDSITGEENWGYFGRPDPSDLLIGDMHTLRTTVQKVYSGVPYFMLGHSMGSYMLRKYLVLHSHDLQGAIIMGTGYVPAGTTKLGMTITRCIAALRGWHYRSKMVADLSFGKPYKRYDLTGKDTKNSWLTKDEEIVKKYYSDPKCTFRFTLNGYMGLFEAVLFSCSEENIQKLPKELPVFFISGADDPVGDMGAGVKKVYHMFREAGMKDLTYKLYENDRHEILNETDRKKVYKDICAWLNVHETA